MSTKAQQIRERVDALVDEGTKKADAFRQLAEEFDQPVDSIRGSYYSAKRAEAGTATPRRRAKKATTTEDAVEAAIHAMRQAIDSIEVEVAAAKHRAEQAMRIYEGLKESSTKRIAAIEAKIAALQGADGGGA